MLEPHVPLWPSSQCVPADVPTVELHVSGFGGNQTGAITYQYASLDVPDGAPTGEDVPEDAWSSGSAARILVQSTAALVDGVPKAFYARGCNAAGLCTTSAASQTLLPVRSAPTAGSASLREVNCTSELREGDDALDPASCTLDDSLPWLNGTRPSIGFVKHTNVQLMAHWTGFVASNGSLAYSACVGTTEAGCQVQSPVEAGTSSDGAGLWQPARNLDLRCEHAYFVRIEAHDCAGNMAAAVSSALRVCCDNPVITELALVVTKLADQSPVATSSVLSPALHEISLTWSSLDHRCSGLRHVEIGLYSIDGTIPLFSWSATSSVPYNHSWSVSERPSLALVPSSASALMLHGATYRLGMLAVSHSGQRTEAYTAPFVVDRTPPTIGVMFRGQRSASTSTVYTACVNRDDNASQVVIGWQGFTDESSGIDLIELALGSSFGADDLLEFRAVGAASAGVASIAATDLALPAEGERIYARLRATNKVGLSSVSSLRDGVLVVDSSRGAAACI
jgi:hypothetical protein